MVFVVETVEKWTIYIFSDPFLISIFAVENDMETMNIDIGVPYFPTHDDCQLKWILRQSDAAHQMGILASLEKGPRFSWVVLGKTILIYL